MWLIKVHTLPFQDTGFWWVCAWLELRLANPPPTKDCTAAMGCCMTSDHDTGVSMSPQPPQDGRWAIFVPAR
jgi:hypothetical protein